MRKPTHFRLQLLDDEDNVLIASKGEISSAMNFDKEIDIMHELAKDIRDILSTSNNISIELNDRND